MCGIYIKMYLSTFFKNDGCTTEVNYDTVPVKKILQCLKYTLIYLLCISYKVHFTPVELYV